MHCGAFWCIYRRWLFSPQTQEVEVEVGVMGKEVKRMTKVSSQIRNCFDFSPSEYNKPFWMSGWNYFFLYALSNYQGHLVSLKQTTGRINKSNRILFFLCQHTHILTVMSTLMLRFPDILDGGTSRMDAVVAQVLFINLRSAWIVMTMWWENRRTIHFSKFFQEIVPWVGGNILICIPEASDSLLVSTCVICVIFQF